MKEKNSVKLVLENGKTCTCLFPLGDKGKARMRIEQAINDRDILYPLEDEAIYYNVLNDGVPIEIDLLFTNRVIGIIY